jgi:hypothetical protein
MRYAPFEELIVEGLVSLAQKEFGQKMQEIGEHLGQTG